jgi:hypothetical protein
VALVYIEYISRRPQVGLEEFHRVIKLGQTGWAGGYEDDVMVMNVGRTWRLGPDPEYMCVWYSPAFGLERLDDWERAFGSGEAEAFEEPFRLAGRIDRAGCYEPLLEPVVGSKGRYYAEHLDLAPGASHDDVRSAYAERRDRHPALELNLLIDRIGALGPEPRALAVWGLPTWGHLEEIARELDDADGPVRLVTASLFADFGDEQL